jgi:hypothetical protein
MMEEHVINIDPESPPQHTNVGSRTNSPDKSIQALPGANVNANHFTEHSKLLPWLMLCCIMSAFAMATSMFATGAVWVLYTKFHVLTVTVDNHDALMLREGIKQPGDIAKGPNGNLEYKRKER